MLTLEAAPEEEVEDKTDYRKENQCDHPRQRADGVAVLLKHNHDTAYDRDDISNVDYDQYQIVDFIHSQAILLLLFRRKVGLGCFA